MQSLSEIRRLLDERGLRPRKRFGQSFLHDANQVVRLVAAAAITPGEVVLEVGPGTGALTEALLDAGARIVACEIDRDLAALIEHRFGDRIALVTADCLDGRALAAPVVRALDGRSFKLVANLPYQVASPLIATLLLDHHETCRGQWVTIQREVADRLVAPPGEKSYGPLGILVQALATVKRLAIVPATCFWPAPKVTSAMVAIEPRAHGVEDPHAFARFVTALFSKRRKQLGAIFGRDRSWPEGVKAEMRPEVLTVGQLVELWRSMNTRVPPGNAGVPPAPGSGSGQDARGPG